MPAVLDFQLSKKNIWLLNFRFANKLGRRQIQLVFPELWGPQKDSNGERLFDSTEFLTSQQIASFFSRLASKRSLTDVAKAQSDEVEEQTEADQESQLQVLRKQVMSDISI